MSNRCSLLASVLLGLIVSVDGTGARNLRDSVARLDPLRDTRVRLPHRAFQTWIPREKPNLKTMALDKSENPSAEDLADFMGNSGSAKKPEIMDAINQFRAKICYQMKDDHGRHFESYEACKKFMEEACEPGDDKVMDGDKGEVSSQHGYCAEYFHAKKKKKDAEEKAKADKELAEMKRQQELEKEEAEARAAEEAAAKKAAEEEAARKAAEAEAAKKKADAKKAASAKPAADGKAGAAPAPAAAGAPGAPGGKYPPDEAWYYKKNGKDPARFHMDENLKLPTHGYWGKMVDHDDMKSSTSDWNKEFHDDHAKEMEEACLAHPENAWCRKKGLSPLGQEPHSNAFTMAISVFPVLLVVAGLQ